MSAETTRPPSEKGDATHTAAVYKHSLGYAKKAGELRWYQDSCKDNMACKQAIEAAIQEHNGQSSFDSNAAVRDVVKKFGYDRVFYILAATLYNKEQDGQFSSDDRSWAETILPFEVRALEKFNTDSLVQSPPALTKAFLETARHEYLLSKPLTRKEVLSEIAALYAAFSNLQEPNSPDGTHYMVQVSPDFWARARADEKYILKQGLHFSSFTFSSLEGREGVFAMVSKDDGHFRKLFLNKPSVRKKLQAQPAADAPKPPAKGRNQDPER